MLKPTSRIVQFGISTLALSLSLLAQPAAAQTTIVSTYGTIDQTQANQLGAWLGEGPIKITNIFTKVNADSLDHRDWRAAVHNKGRTFTVAKIRFNLNSTEYTRVVGGYNPTSWNSGAAYQETPNDNQRTAFLYDLTLGLIQRQDTNAMDAAGSNTHGRYQTYDDGLNGPIWGGGPDLRFYGHLRNGDANGATYNGAHPGNFNNLLRANAATQNDTQVFFGIDQMEVFTIENDDTAPAVPEPGALALFLPALAVVGWTRRRRTS